VIDVVLAEDHALVRKGIRGLLELSSDIRVVAEADNGPAAVAAISRLQPDVALLDVYMPGCTGIEVLEALAATGQTFPPCILLTTFDDDDALLKGMQAGAKGFLLKSISPERLAESIRQVVQGKTVFRPAITDRVLDSIQSPDSRRMGRPVTPSILSERETEVLALMAAGFNNLEISEALGSREGTVRNQVSSILSKLGVRDRLRAVLRALEFGYI
jgi:DNA-binding NarL/FixJ family response regulator